MSNMLVLFMIAAFPAVLIGWFIYIKDRDKEPIGLLVKLFIGGIISTVITLVVTLILEPIIPIFSTEASDVNPLQLLINVFIGVALIEELSKWCLLYTIGYKANEFDELYDMVEYGVYVALGFAFLENIFYVFEGGFGIGIIRAIFSVPGHAFYGVFMGYYLGLARVAAQNKNSTLEFKNKILSILIPMLLHGFFDYCLFSEIWQFYILFLVFVIILYYLSIRKVLVTARLSGKPVHRIRYCTNCGNQVNTNFCTVCGRKSE